MGIYTIPEICDRQVARQPFLLQGRSSASYPSEFVEFLSLANQYYPSGARIRVVLDNHLAHISRETWAYLTSVPNRFEFVFTPKHGSWLNLVESFFGKLARTLLRGIRVTSRQELLARIELYLKEVNEEPTVFKWKYKLEALATESVAL